MSESETMSKQYTVESPAGEKRRGDTNFLLVPLDPQTVVDGRPVGDGCYLADSIVMTGSVRETCPECKTVHLKLVLRQMHVKKAHLFCEQCTRCFDAVYADGSPALLIA